MTTRDDQHRAALLDMLADIESTTYTAQHYISKLRAVINPEAGQACDATSEWSDGTITRCELLKGHAGMHYESPRRTDDQS